MRKKLARTITPEMQAILEHNGIDWQRVAKCKITHAAEGVVTTITVTMFALDPNEQPDPLPSELKVVS